MICVEICRPGGPEVLEPVERPDPVPGPGDVLIRVAGGGREPAGRAAAAGRLPAAARGERYSGPRGRRHDCRPRRRA